MNTQLRHDSAPAAGASTRRALAQGARAEIVRSLSDMLLYLGWNVTAGDPRAERKCFEPLLPEPDLTFTIAHTGTGQRCPVALHFFEDGKVLRYACTVCSPDGDFIHYRGELDNVRGAKVIESTRGQWNLAPDGGGFAPPVLQIPLVPSFTDRLRGSRSELSAPPQ